MDRQFLSHDPLNGITSYFSHDHKTDTSVIEYVGDCEPVLEMNKKMANDTDFTKQGIKDEFWLYASIPAILQLKWLTEEGIDVWNKAHADRVSKKLEDPQYRYLKTTSGKHIFKS